MILNEEKMKAKKKLGYFCENCDSWVNKDQFIGTHFRNHCPFCLYSKHLDAKESGDRNSSCHGLMEPVGLTFKHEGLDKYNRPRQGELMLVHHCSVCHDFSINRLSADDEAEMVMFIFNKSKSLPEEVKKNLQAQNIELLTDKDEPEIRNQLFGKKV
jgi:hypothetical protein